MKPEQFWRVRAACSDTTSLSPEELEAHADAVTAVVVEAQSRGPLAFRMHEQIDDEPREAA